MARKPRIQAYARRRAKLSRAGRRFYQCMLCGALTDPIYGVGDNSWCPSCHAIGDICYAEGQIPDPAFYGSWLAEQEEKTKARTAQFKKDPNPQLISTLRSTLSQSTLGEFEMKTPTFHSGVFHCRECAIEFDLIAEKVLKCDQCDGLLVKGSLADDPNDDEDEDE